MNRTMQAKNKKVKTMGMKASKAVALGESMNELGFGFWCPYWVMIKKDGVEMYRNHAEFMRKWNERKAVTA